MQLCTAATIYDITDVSIIRKLTRIRIRIRRVLYCIYRKVSEKEQRQRVFLGKHPVSKTHIVLKIFFLFFLQYDKNTEYLSKSFYVLLGCKKKIFFFTTEMNGLANK